MIASESSIPEPHDADRERIRARARLTRDVLDDLEEAALSAASRHTHQVDALKAELAAALQRASGEGVDMTVGLDDIRAVLADVGNAYRVVEDLLVLDDGQIQVVDSIHALVDHVIAVDAAWPAADLADLRTKLLWTETELGKQKSALADAIAGATADADATAGFHAEEMADLTRLVRGLGKAMALIDPGVAEVALHANIGAALETVAGAILELGDQMRDGGDGLQQTLLLERADCHQTKAQFNAVESALEAVGMPRTLERDEIPAWLAANMKPKAKAHRVKAAASDDEGAFVIMRNDANGRRFLGPGVESADPLWTTLPGAFVFGTVARAEAMKTRGSKVTRHTDAEALVANDARVAAGYVQVSAGGAE